MVRHLFWVEKYKWHNASAALIDSASIAAPKNAREFEGVDCPAGEVIRWCEGFFKLFGDLFNWPMMAGGNSANDFCRNLKEGLNPGEGSIVFQLEGGGTPFP